MINVTINWTDGFKTDVQGEADEVLRKVSAQLRSQGETIGALDTQEIKEKLASLPPRGVISHHSLMPQDDGTCTVLDIQEIA